MKSIELTEEHKSRLLEMCKELFPEYYKIEFFDDYYTEWCNFLDIKLTKNIGDSIEIHWFEFCVNYLPQKMGLKFFNYTRWVSDEGYIHLVDYLHIQWKKLSQQ